MKIAIVTTSPVLPVSRRQVWAATDWGAEKIWIDQAEEALTPEGTRQGDIVGVYRLAALAPHGKRLGKRRRDRLIANADRIHALGATIHEIETGRNSKTQLAAMLDDAFAMLSTGRVHREPKKRGRTKTQDYTTDQENEIMAIWRDASKTTDQRIEILRSLINPKTDKQKYPLINKAACYRIQDRHDAAMAAHTP